MSAASNVSLRRFLVVILVVSLVLLYAIHYASIKILPIGKEPAGLLDDLSYDHNIYQNKFVEQWCLGGKETGNWRAIIRPCLGLLTWERKESLPDLFETDPLNSFIADTDIRHAGEFSRISIVTKARTGLTKTIGGDSWRIKINGTASLNAKVIDHSNGTYDVIFLCMDQGVYFVHIYLDYSLCNGLRDPPRDWFKKGNSQGKYQGVNVVGEPKDLLMYLLKGTPIRIDVKPRRLALDEIAPSCNHTSTILWNGQGRWKDSKWIPNFQDDRWMQRHKKMPQKERGNLIVYGDSVNVFFAQSLQHRKSICGGIFRSCSFSYNWVYQIQNVSLAKTQKDKFDINITRILYDFENTVNTSDYNNEQSVVIVNFGLHFVESTNFSNYQILVENVAKIVTEKDDAGGKKFRGKVIWKTTTAINKERADFPHLHWRRFFTNYRIQLYNAYAVDVMCKYGIPVIDAYLISESYPHGTGTHAGRSPSKNDIVHYNNEAFYPIEEFIQHYFS